MSLFSTTSEARASNGSRKEKGRDRNAEKLVRRDFASDRRIAAASSSINCVRPCMSPFRAQPMGGLRPNDGITVGIRGQMLLRRPKAAKTIHSQHAASGPAGSRNHLCQFGVHLTGSD